MQAGKLRHPLRLEAPSLQKEETGGYEPADGGPASGWQSLGKIWGEVVDVTARERFAVGQLDSGATTRVTVREDSRITAACRLIHGSRTLYIVGPPIRDGRSRQMTLTCAEKSL